MNAREIIFIPSEDYECPICHKLFWTTCPHGAGQIIQHLTRPVENELKAEIKRLNRAMDEIISIQPSMIYVHSDHTSSVPMQDYQVIKNIALFARRTEVEE